MPYYYNYIPPEFIIPLFIIIAFGYNLYFTFYVLINNKISDNDKKYLLKTYLLKSILNISFILIAAYLYNDCLEFIKKIGPIKSIIILLLTLYYSYSIYIYHKLINNKYDLSVMNDNKNLDLKYHIYASIPVLIIIIFLIIQIFKIYNKDEKNKN